MPRGSWVYTPPPPTEVGYALGRLPERTYISRSFRLDLRNSQDYGEPARYVTKVFDEAPESEYLGTAEEIEWTEAVVSTTPGGRKQIKIQIARQAGQVREIEIQKVPTNGDAERMDSLLKLDRESSARLIQVIQSLQYVPVEATRARFVSTTTSCGSSSPTPRTSSAPTAVRRASSGAPSWTTLMPMT